MSSSGFLRMLDSEPGDKEKQEEKKPVESIKIEEDSVPSVNNEDAVNEPDENHERTEADEADKTDRAKWNKAKLLREKNRELERQNIELSQKMEALDGQLQQVYNSNIYNYGSNVATNLDVAKREYKDALENGSVEDITNATANYTVALNEFENAKRIVEDHNVINQRYQNERQPAQIHPNNSNDEYEHDEWLRENPELDSSSKYYDKNLEKKIINEANKLNNYLKSEGQEHLVGSRAYLDKLDEFVEYYKNNSSNNLRGYGVTNLNNITASKNYNDLDERERNAAAAYNMTPQEFRASQARLPEIYKIKQEQLRRRG